MKTSDKAKAILWYTERAVVIARRDYYSAKASLESDIAYNKSLNDGPWDGGFGLPSRDIETAEKVESQATDNFLKAKEIHDFAVETFLEMIDKTVDDNLNS